MQNTNIIFITGTGTGIGKTFVSAIVAEALQADYWKPVQAGFSEGTDADAVKNLLSNPHSAVHKEIYKLALPASPHIAAREENISISLQQIVKNIPSSDKKYLVAEGAGGLMVPLNENEFVADLIEQLSATVILVSRNYLGSINHSLLTAAGCKRRNIKVAGWIFNDTYMHYEDDIVKWSGYKKIASIPYAENLNKEFVAAEAEKIKASLQQWL